MNITWDEADPRHLFSALFGTCVRINGEDVGVWDLWKSHVDVCDWQDEIGVSNGVNVRSVPWDEIAEMHVY